MSVFMQQLSDQEHLSSIFKRKLGLKILKKIRKFLVSIPINNSNSAHFPFFSYFAVSFSNSLRCFLYLVFSSHSLFNLL